MKFYRSRTPGKLTPKQAALVEASAEMWPAPAAPWLDKPELADHLACSVRWVELRMVDGLPHKYIAGRVKFKVAPVDDWLAANGHVKDRED